MRKSPKATCFLLLVEGHLTGSKTTGVFIFASVFPLAHACSRPPPLVLLGSTSVHTRSARLGSPSMPLHRREQVCQTSRSPWLKLQQPHGARKLATKIKRSLRCF